MKANKQVRVDVSKIQSQEHAAYVLITCGNPRPDGKMQVEMMYEGDPVLASYLLQSAQDFIEPEDD